MFRISRWSDNSFGRQSWINAQLQANIHVHVGLIFDLRFLYFLLLMNMHDAMMAIIIIIITAITVISNVDIIIIISEKDKKIRLQDGT